jgi:hypothetical protein
MRKLFWTSLTCGVVLAGGVISTASFAVRHPESVIGRVLHGASYVAALVNPVSGLTPLAKQAREADSTIEEQSAENGETEVWQPDPVAVPEDPIPVREEVEHRRAPEPGPIVVANNGAPAITIHEEDKVATPIPEYAPEPTSLPIPTGSTEPAGAIRPTSAECPAAEGATAPQVMPYCHDEQEYELLPMPKEEIEVLHMPRPVEEDGGMSMGNEPTYYGNFHFLRCAGTEEPCNAIHHAVRKLSIFPDHGDENCPVHPEIDTMEFRPSDGHLYDYGPSAL